MTKKSKEQDEPKIKAKIFIDTNKLIEILQSWTKEEIDKFLNKSKSIIFAEQSYDEFLRNMDRISDKMYSTLIIQDLKGSGFSKDLQNNAKKINQAIEKFNKDLHKELKEKADFLLDVIKNKTVSKSSEVVLQKARLRKEKGNPPSSGTSIGDEIIWESLLSWGKDNIIILTQDTTWRDNIIFLQSEYERLTNKKLINIVSNLNEAKKIIGEQNDILELEKLENNSKLVDMFYQMKAITDKNSYKEFITPANHLNIVMKDFYEKIKFNDVIDNIYKLNGLVIPYLYMLKNNSNSFDKSEDKKDE